MKIKNTPPFDQLMTLQECIKFLSMPKEIFKECISNGELTPLKFDNSWFFEIVEVHHLFLMNRDIDTIKDLRSLPVWFKSSECRVLSHWLGDKPCNAGIVYIVDIGNGFIKIGKTKAYLQARLKDIQSKTPQYQNKLLFTLNTSCCLGLERHIHCVYNNKMHPVEREWFNLTGKELKRIETIKEFNFKPVFLDFPAPPMV